MGTQKKRSARELLWFEVAAFGLIIALSWADEILGLPAKLFGGTHRPDIGEAILETFVVLLVAVPILIHTRRVVSRPFYFEGFLRVCACLCSGPRARVLQNCVMRQGAAVGLRIAFREHSR